MGRVEYFGVKISEKEDGMKLTRENYIKIDNKSSFTNEIYTDDWCKKQAERCLYNYDKNIDYFNSLDEEEFNTWLNDYVNKNSFVEILNLNDCEEKSGYYIMVLGEYKQVYIGTAKNIKKRIMAHWRETKKFDRLIFGTQEDSIISIDSFRAFDTTRIFAFFTDKVFVVEDELINKVPAKYCLNRTAGGITDNDLIKAIAKRKTRDLNSIYDENETIYTINDLMKIMKCSRYMIMKYYSQQKLPLKKEKNKYIISKKDFDIWKEKFDRKRAIEVLISLSIALCFIIFILIKLNIWI